MIPDIQDLLRQKKELQDAIDREIAETQAEKARLVAALNQCNQMTSQDWQVFENTGQLPKGTKK